MAANCSINLSSIFNIPTISYSHRSHTRHSHPILIFSVKTEEKLLGVKSPKNKLISNGVVSQRNDLKSTMIATLPSKEPLNFDSSFVFSAPSRLLPLGVVLCNVVDDIINYFISNLMRPFMAPRFFLVENFSLMHETILVVCSEMESTLLDCINGVFICNEMNPIFIPKG